MPPALATLLCTIFILLLFYGNSKKTRGVSFGLWVPTIWVGLLIIRALGSWIAGTNGGLNFNAALDGSPIDRNALLILITLGSAILARRGVQLGSVLKDNRWLCIFYLYCLVSVLWSDYSFVAFKRWFRDAASVIMILVILTEDDPTEALRQVFLRCAYLCIPLSILMVKYYPTMGLTYNMWTGEAVLCGVTPGKNQLGRFAMLSALFLLWSLSLQQGNWFKRIKERWFDAAVFALCLFVLFKANSQTSLFCFGLGVFVFFATQMNWVKTNNARLVFVGCALIALSVLFFSVPDLRGIITGALHRNVNLTDRTDVWAGCFRQGTNPLIGVGFASFWITPAGIHLGNMLQVEEAHNGFLETYLNGGIIAVALLVLVLVVAGKNAVRQVAGNSPVGPMYACLFLVGVIYNYTEAAFDDGNLVGFVIWIVAVQYQTATEAVAVEPSIETNRCAPGPASSFAMLLRKD